MVRFIFCLLFLTISFRPFAQNNLRDCVVSTAYSYIDVRETDGSNRSPEIRHFFDYLNCTVPYGSPWCAIYVSYCLKYCGVKAPYSAWSPSLFPKYAIKYSNGIGNDDKVQKGDVFGIYFTRLGRIAHVGFIVEDRYNMVKTIEGNTNGGGSRDGDGVYERVRFKSQIAKVASYYEQ